MRDTDNTRTVVPENTESLSTSFMPKGHSRLVQAYKSEDGQTHKSLHDAIEHDVAAVYEAMVEEVSGDMSRNPKAIAAMMLKPQYRQRIIRLMKELD